MISSMPLSPLYNWYYDCMYVGSLGPRYRCRVLDYSNLFYSRLCDNGSKFNYSKCGRIGFHLCNNWKCILLKMDVLYCISSTLYLLL